MLEYDRIDILEGIDVNKTNSSKNLMCVIIGIFLDKGFKYEPYLCNGCHDLMQKTINFNIPIVSTKGSDYRIHFWYTNKDDVINIMKNSNLNEKQMDYYNFFHYI